MFRERERNKMIERDARSDASYNMGKMSEDREDL